MLRVRTRYPILGSNMSWNIMSEDQIQYRRELQDYVVIAQGWLCCLNCEQWGNVNTNTGEILEYHHCQLGNAIPPPHVIISGCQCWQAKIPFK